MTIDRHRYDHCRRYHAEVCGPQLGFILLSCCFGELRFQSLIEGFMKKIALPVVLLLSVFAWAEPNPSDYPISVHVNSAQVLSVTGAFGRV